ncbi:acyl-CoA dehydrogenase [Mycolicibacterium litorale]|uniref:Acyl-CoA dehydrogenase n=1 Tax=Mycolicibacterium litorale TaxID=758802 RepID=A0A6S6P2G6_9MYCO|nr:acyl-CoA dehydrogenase family protein [Mycolicibacterium litorale]BCI51771.1 acyl-CoA dehydrogenase [Mycolicibacterium litorale]
MHMTDTHGHLDDLRATARGVSATHLAVDSHPNPALDRELWDELEKLGFIGLCAPESVGGADGDLLDAAAVLGELTTARIPFAEAAFIAAPALGTAGLALPSGPFTAAQGAVAMEAGTVSGQVDRVPFARDCESLVLLVPGAQPVLCVISLGGDGVSVEAGQNLAGEPRDTVALRQVTPLASAEVAGDDVTAWQLRGALARAVASAGAAAAIVDQTARYVSERVQFGRPLMKFQVVQHAVARMAADATAMQTAATAATLAMLEGSDSTEMMVAAAKAETAILSRPVTAAAHQAHGAIGFTQEHVLGALTTRLWAWREEFGNERYWHQRLGELARGRDLWQLVTGQQ